MKEGGCSGAPMPEQCFMVVFRRVVSVLFLCSLLLVGAQETQKLRVGLGYLPDVQFAPFYLAVAEGLYAAQGLEVEFQHGFVTELYPLLSTGRLDFVVGDAEDVIALRAQNEQAAPFQYIMAMYQKVPNVLFSLADVKITSIEDLKGKTLGIPGLFGTSYTSLQAVLKAAGLEEDDLRIEQIGFTQVEAVLAGRVDVAMGFINNEPIILESQGISANIIDASSFNLSAGNGIITTDKMLENNSLVESFLLASQQALELTLNQPELAFEASKQYVENLSDDRMAVLLSSTKLYTSDFSNTLGIGFSDPKGWEDTLELLKQTGRVETALPANAFYSNDFLTLGVGTD